ncbi:MAG: HEAT repeat domain-containing protein [Bacteroidota bacterium]
MTPNFTDADLIDYLSGELDSSQAEVMEKALRSDETLRQKLSEYRDVQQWMENLDAPTSTYSADAFLKKAEKDMGETFKVLRPVRVSRFRLMALAASVLLIFSLGWWMGRSFLEPNSQVQANQWEELLDGERSSHRIEAARLIADQTSVDFELVSRLGTLLREDPSPNVRLAALEALASLGHDPNAREQMIRSLEPNGPAAVQIQLIETLIALEETQILPRLRDWSQDLSLPQYLRDAAELGRFKLDKI